jgi:DNA repair protein RecO (recombination protein O)
MLSAPKLDALLSALLLVGTSLPERDPHPAIYHGLLDFFASLTQSDAAGWLEHYVRLELQLLAELGFGLDLSCCAATGSAENLAYVSPRSARAVSKEAGLPYHERLLPLPAFLNQGGAPQAGDLLSGLKLTGYFLEKHLAEQRPGGLPSPRERIFAHIQRLMPGGLPLPA